MQLDHIAAIVAAAGAGPLAFVALGLLVLTYLSARWFGTERTAVRITVFAFLFLLICATPILLWLSDHYRGTTAAEQRPDGDASGNTVAPSPAPSAGTPAAPFRPEARPGPTATTTATRPAPAGPDFVEEREPVRFGVSRLESALRAGVFTVYFPLDQSNLTPGETAFLDDVADEFSRRGASLVELAGHTDRWGSATNNLSLSQRMADAVKTYLANHGVPEGAISTEAFGESRPAVETADNIPEPRNRRVEIRFR